MIVLLLELAYFFVERVANVPSLICGTAVAEYFWVILP
jgi:hypothetical protein